MRQAFVVTATTDTQPIETLGATRQAFVTVLKTEVVRRVSVGTRPMWRDAPREVV
jgi:hypothetical protein